MIGEEYKFLHPAPCRKYTENPERKCRAQCKGYHPELCKYSRATRECYNDRCFRIHLKGTRRKQTPPSTHEPSTTPRITNQQHAMIKTQNLAYTRPPPLLTLPTPPPTKPITLPSAWFSRIEKKRESMLIKPRRSELQEDRAYNYGCNSWSPLRDAVGSYKKNSSVVGTIYYLNLDSPVPNYPHSYAPLHARRPCMKWAGGKG